MSSDVAVPKVKLLLKQAIVAVTCMLEVADISGDGSTFRVLSV